MKYAIKKNFYPKIDFLKSESFRAMKYNLGALSKQVDINNIFHLSNSSKERTGSFYEFYINNNNAKKKPRAILFYLSDFSKETLDAILEFNFQSYNYHYYVSTLSGDFESQIRAFFDKNSIPELSFINYLKRSQLTDWQIQIPTYLNLNLECVVLNCFLALGANLPKTSSPTKIGKITSLAAEKFDLSFQHGIIIYKII